VKISKDYMAKLIKEQILSLKTSQFKTACKDDSGCITQLKQQKSKKMILLVSTLTIRLSSLLDTKTERKVTKLKTCRLENDDSVFTPRCYSL